MTPPEGMELPEGFQMPEGMEFPMGSEFPSGGNAEPTEGITPTETDSQQSDVPTEEGTSQQKRPNRSETGNPGNDRGSADRPNGMMQPGGASAASLQNILVLGICIVLLIAALLFAKFYKRRK